MAIPKVINDSSSQGVDTPDYNGFSKVVPCGATAITADKMMGLAAVGTSDGLAYVASDAASRRVIGIIVGGGTDLDGVVATSGQDVVIRAGTYMFANDTGTAVTRASIGAKCYVKDYKTVTGAAGSNSVIAGMVIDIRDGLVAVAVGLGYMA